MKNLILILLVFIGGITNAQKVNQCGIIIPPASLRSQFSSVYEAKSYIDDMLQKIKWRENFELREQNGIDNAYATIIRNQRYIIYDNRFLESLDRYAGTKWASISVLAHEMGHHYRDHVVSGAGSTPPKELEADYFSGYVMAKMGATVAEARAAMEQIASPRASASHPAKADRLNSIAEGWNYANGVEKQNTPNNPNPVPAPQPQQNPPPASNDASWIYLSLYGNSNMTVYLSDDGKTFSEAPLNTQQPFVFKFEVYNYGWLRFTNNSRAKTYRLNHGKDFAIIWSRRNNNWTVIEVP